MPTKRSSRNKVPKLKIPKKFKDACKKNGDDEQTTKCYAAEQLSGVCSVAELANFADVKRFVLMVCRGEMWQSKFKGKQLQLWYGKKRGNNYAYGGKVASGLPMIYLPPTRHGRSVHTIIHEFAHAYLGGGGHSPRFIHTMLRFMKDYEGDFHAKRLKTYMKATGALP